MNCKYFGFSFYYHNVGPLGYPETSKKDPIHCPNCGKLVAQKKTGGW